MGVVRLKIKLQEGYESKLREYASWKKSAKGYEPSKPCEELLEDIHLYQVPFTVFIQLLKKKKEKEKSKVTPFLSYSTPISLAAT